MTSLSQAETTAMSKKLTDITYKKSHSENSESGMVIALPKRSDIEELHQAIDFLRLSLKEMVDQYALRIGGQLARVKQITDLRQFGDEKRLSPSHKTVREMLDLIRTTKIKPAKGRAKDFVRIQELIDEFIDLLPDES